MLKKIKSKIKNVKVFEKLKNAFKNFSMPKFGKKKNLDQNQDAPLNLNPITSNQDKSDTTNPNIPSIPKDETLTNIPNIPENDSSESPPPLEIVKNEQEQNLNISENEKTNFKDKVIEIAQTSIHKLKNLKNKPKKSKKPILPGHKTPNTFIVRIQEFLYAESFIEKVKQLFHRNQNNLATENPNYIYFLERIFAIQKREDFHKHFLLAIFLFSAFGMGKIIAFLLQGSPNYSKMGASSIQKISFAKMDQPADLMSIKQKKIFQTGAIKKIEPTKTKVKPKGPEICLKANKNTALPLKLLNTIVLQDSVKSMASVQVRNELIDYREGEKIDNLAKIDRISRMQIVIKNLNNGECENVFASEASEMNSPETNITVLNKQQSVQFKKQQKNIEGIKNDGNKFEVSKNLMKSKMANISDILSQARGIPITNPDGTMSFKIVDIEPGSIYTYLGIEDNDVITSINGQKINNLNEVMSLFGRIQELDQLQISVQRNGTDTPLDYSFK